MNRIRRTACAASATIALAFTAFGAPLAFATTDNEGKEAEMNQVDELEPGRLDMCVMPADAENLPPLADGDLLGPDTITYPLSTSSEGSDTDIVTYPDGINETIGSVVGQQEDVVTYPQQAVGMLRDVQEAEKLAGYLRDRGHDAKVEKSDGLTCINTNLEDEKVQEAIGDFFWEMAPLSSEAIAEMNALEVELHDALAAQGIEVKLVTDKNGLQWAEVNWEDEEATAAVDKFFEEKSDQLAETEKETD